MPDERTEKTRAIDLAVSQIEKQFETDRAAQAGCHVSLQATHPVLAARNWEIVWRKASFHRHPFDQQSAKYIEARSDFAERDQHTNRNN